MTSIKSLRREGEGVFKRMTGLKEARQGETQCYKGITKERRTFSTGL